MDFSAKTISPNYLVRIIVILTGIFLFNTCLSQESHNKKWKEAFDAGVSNYEWNRSKKALILFNEAFEIAEANYDNTDWQLGRTAYYISQIYLYAEQWSEAIPFMLVELEYIGHNKGENHPSFISRLDNLFWVYRKLGKNHKALSILEQKEEALKGKIPDLILHLSHKAVIYAKIYEHKRAVILYKQVLELIEKQFGKEYELYGVIQHNLAEALRYSGDFAGAVHHSKLALELCRRYPGDNNAILAMRLHNYAASLKSIGQIKEASQHYHDALILAKKYYNPEDSFYLTLVLNMASLKMAEGDYEDAKEHYSSIRDATKTALGPSNDIHLALINGLALANYNLGNLPEALVLFEEGIRIIESRNQQQTPLYGILMTGLAQVHMDLGRVEDALTTSDNAVEHIRETFGESHISYGIALSNLGNLLVNGGLYTEAQEIIEKAISILEASEPTPPDFPVSLTLLAAVFLETSQTEKAIPILYEALQITQNTLGSVHPNNTKIYNALGIAFEKSGDHTKAIEHYEKALALVENVHGKNTFNHSLILHNLGLLYLKTQNCERMIEVFQNAMKGFHKEIDRIFSFSTELEKKAYLNIPFSIFEFYFSLPSQSLCQIEKLDSINLSNVLNMKSLLLNSKKNVFQDLNNGLLDVNTIDIIKAYQKISRKITKSQLEQGVESQPQKELLNSRDSLEKLLVSQHNKLFGQTNFSNMKLPRLRSSLGENDVAIEFIHFRQWSEGEWTDSTFYKSFLVRPNDARPIYLHHFNETKFKEILSSNLSESIDTRGATSSSTFTRKTLETLYELIWKPLEPFLESTENIYFSPDGLLHQIPLLALPDSTGKVMSNKFKMSQMASTATLIETKPQPKPNDILLIGGIDYSYKNETILNEKNRSYSYLETTSLKTSKSNRDKGSKWPYLAGTKQEVGAISELFSHHQKSYLTWEGQSATEERFKALSSNSPSILHIATHGFFFENQTKKPAPRLNQPQYTLSDDPLIRSGLVMAGGNYAWQNGSNPYEEEDGILTALEIANLDLSNTQLVVLSACDTGLGDIDGSEGVYGLQRAFRMAGVQNIIMSLWEVPDKETAEFMELFYSKWLVGSTLRAAFNDTQKRMAEKYKNEPQKWAGFILVQ